LLRDCPEFIADLPQSALASRVIHFHFACDKSLRHVVGRVPPQALKIIIQYLTSNGAVPRASDPLICKQGGSGDALSYHVINRVVTRWTKPRLGVRLTPHKLRHAYGRQCVDLGVDIRIIAEALGHESLESTKIYTQVSFQRTRRIAELFGPRGLK
jgi:site-specific recombinase XerD